MPRIAGLVDRLQDAVDLVGLEQRAGVDEQRVLNALPTGEPLADAFGLADFMQDASVDLPRPVLAGRRVGQPQQVQVRAVVARVTDLASGQERLQGERPGEGHHGVRVRRRCQTMVHHLRDEAWDAQQRFGQRARIRRAAGAARRTFDPAEDAGQVDIGRGLDGAVTTVTGLTQ